MDEITELYKALHPGESFNFYKLSGFRAGFNGKSGDFSNFDNLPESLVNQWKEGHKEGKEAKIGQR